MNIVQQVVDENQSIHRVSKQNQLWESTLKDTILDSTEFQSSQLKQIEFQVCILNDMYIHDTPFKSCAISISQAVTFAGLMRLKVRD